jgi:GNAT superfamily N-acetyltransferase
MNEQAIAPRAPRPRPRMPSVTVRLIDASDREELARFYAALSPESRRRRFLGVSSGIPDRSCRSLCTPDHKHEEGFVAVSRSDGPDDGRIVGHLCLVRAESSSVELAVAVSEDQQGHGIGRRLFVAALDWADEHHIASLTASAFADNARVLRLLSSAPLGARLHDVGAGVVEIEIPIGENLP